MSAARPSRSRRIRWCGPLAFLAQCDSLPEVMVLHAHLQEHPLEGQVEALAAAQTVLVRCRTRAHAQRAAQHLQHLDVGAPDLTALPAGQEVWIDVVYDGEDLQQVGELTGLGAEGVVRVHTQTLWRGAFGGFAPGFTYLTPTQETWNIPRRSSPLTEVPAGSVALAGDFSAVYPRSSPGGWQLIGHTTQRMWDLSQEPPALIRPGDRVRYRAVRESATLVSAGIPDGERPAPPSPLPGQEPSAESNDATPQTGSALTVVSPGLQSLLQDLGRPGRGDLGVSASGAADQDAAREANRAVGNPEDATVVETVLGGLSVRARGHHVLVLTGAAAPARIQAAPDGVAEDRPAPSGRPFALYCGETLTLGMPEAGLRTYLAVRGGIQAPTTLGSSATDLLAGLGPDPLQAEDELAVGVGRGAVQVTDPSGGPSSGTRRGDPLPQVGQITQLRVRFGPRDDWFDDAAQALFTAQEWSVSDQSNRIGVRLLPPEGGRTLERCREGELPSEGCVPGSLQIPPSGAPVLFLADHPVTGGYPVIAVVAPEDLHLAAQLPPGAKVRFAPDAPGPSSVTPEQGDTHD